LLLRNFKLQMEFVSLQKRNSMSNKFVTVYHLSVGYIFLSEEPGEGMRERQMTLLFVADNHYQALVSAAAWAKDRFEQVIKDSYKNASIGSLKVSEYFIGEIASSGRSTTGYGLPFIEWKCDFPTSLEQHIAYSKEKLEKYGRNKEDYIKNIGKQCTKTKGKKEPKPFKSGLKINTIVDVINHPVLSIPAYTFKEDDSYVECRRCSIVRLDSSSNV
jgi:hypothetical protein